MGEVTKTGLRGRMLRNAAIAALVIAPIVASGCGVGGGVICENPHPQDPTKCNDPKGDN